MLKRLLEQSRYLVVLAVLSSLVAAAAAFLWGTTKAGLLIWALAHGNLEGSIATVRFVELMDKFLVAAGLYIFAVGLYDLFLGELELPKWLDIDTLHDVKSRLTSILVLIMAITFLERLVMWENPTATLQFGLSIAVVTVALLAFNRFSEKGH